MSPVSHATCRYPREVGAQLAALLVVDLLLIAAECPKRLHVIADCIAIVAESLEIPAPRTTGAGAGLDGQAPAPATESDPQLG